MDRRSRCKSLSHDWDALFSISRKQRGAHPGYVETEKPRVSFCTDSSYVGYWNAVGMSGFGTYTFQHKVDYEGTFNNGQCHGFGTLEYPMGQKLEGQWENGHLISWKYRFADGLEYEEPWRYCVYPDRRFYLSMLEGLRPAGKELKTNAETPRKIPPGCYDTGDGFYNPATKCVMSATDLKKVIRIPTITEEKWIMANCRKAWDEPVGFKPTLYKQWTAGRRKDFEEARIKEDEEKSKDNIPDVPFEKFDTRWLYQLD